MQTKKEKGPREKVQLSTYQEDEVVSTSIVVKMRVMSAFKYAKDDFGPSSSANSIT